MKPIALAVCCWLAIASGPILASTPNEKVICTDLPPSQWMSEQQARTLFKASSYMLVKFKVSKGRCHEFYAVEHDGTVVEAYVHPVTGKTVRITRVPPQPGAVKP